jgi:GMP synthase (glutamine-hydrolysing)
MNVLIIDNNIDREWWGAPDLRKFAEQAAGAVVHVRRAPQGDLPASPSGFDRIIVSGSKTRIDDSSPWVLDLMEFIRKAISENKPYLGVCYGHQMLARALSGETSVGAAALGEIGWTRIEVTAQSKLFEGLPGEFHSFSSHFDEVKQVPSGFRAIARSEACGVQAMQLGEKPVYGIQFHPERDLPQGEARYQSAKKQNTDPRFILNAGKGAKLFDPKVGERIFANFLAGNSLT